MTEGAGPPGWLRAALRVRPAPVPVGHSIRAAITVGVPVAVGYAIGDLALGVLVALACVLRTVGERQAAHRVNIRNLLVATPLAACGYLFAPAGHLPLVPLVLLMAAVAFGAGILASQGEAFALGAMQLLLVTSIAIGVGDDGVVRSIGLFLLGAGLYAACMAVDYLVFEPEPPPSSAEAAPDHRGRPALRWKRRAHPSVDPSTLAQAARLALCFGLAVSARGWTDLQHWFWVPATVGLVMQPSFGSVPGRALLRPAGTVVGALVAAAVLAWSPSGVVLAVVIGLLAATIPWAKQASYALQSLALAAVVLLLVDQLAPTASSGLPAQRVVATVLGGAIVFVFGYAVWPEARRIEAEAVEQGR